MTVLGSVGLALVVALHVAAVSAQAVPNLVGRWTPVAAGIASAASDPAITDMAIWTDGPLIVTQDATRTSFTNGRINVICVQQPIAPVPPSRGVSATIRFKVEATVKNFDAAGPAQHYQGSAIWLGSQASATLVLTIPAGPQTTMRLSVYLDQNQLVLERALERGREEVAGSRTTVRYARKLLSVAPHRNRS
jgi:hypothetical protein